MKTVFVLWFLVAHNNVETRPAIVFPTMELCEKAAARINKRVSQYFEAACIEQPEVVEVEAPR